MRTLDRITDWPEQAKKAGYDTRRLAAICRRSPSQLRRFVAHAFGKKLGAWLIELRLCVAAKRLATTEEQVKVIREEAGFKSDSHFCIRFKSLFGISPGKFAAAYSQKRREFRRELKIEFGTAFRARIHMPPELWEELESLVCQKIPCVRPLQRARPVETTIGPNNDHIQ